MSAYIFAHFTGESEDGEQIYFSVSRDGLHWKDLNEGKPVLYSTMGTCGVRDPYLVRNPENGRIYLIATDLRIASGKGWCSAKYEGSRDLIIWESEDLVSWERPRAVRVGKPEAGCVWAPEAVYDKEKGAFFVFFASMVRGEGEPEAKQRIYYVYTEDFWQFTKPVCYMERDSHVIDTTIVEESGRYYRISKDETTKYLLMESADSLLGDFTPVSSRTLEELKGVEGPEIYRLPDGSFCLIADQYEKGLGYLPMITKNLASGEFEILSPENYDLGGTKKRHGGIMEIGDVEYERLISHWAERKDCLESENYSADVVKTVAPRPVLPGLYADPDIAVFGGKTYIYPTTDGFPGWGGTQFFVFSSEDGEHFQKGNLILDVSSEQVPWAVSHAWAPCITKREEKYYFYFCAKNKEGDSCIGMAYADRPEGPFTAMEEPLITMELTRQNGIRMNQTIDPSVYEENGVYYLLFGNGYPAVVQLTDTMDGIVPGTMTNLEGLTDFREAVTVLKRGGLYHFTWSCDDTGSEDYHVNYGISKELYGPVKYCYTILKKDLSHDILGTGHHSIVKLPGEDKYRIAYHRFATPTESYSEGKGYYRETCISWLEFGKDGLMLPVEM